MYHVVSGYLLRGAPYHHPLSKKRTFKKFIGSAWQFVIHLSMTLCELYIAKDETWLSQPWTCFNDYFTFVPKQSLRLFLLLQIAIWVCTCVSHRFNAEAHMHKDYVPMYVHHLATIALVTIAYVINQSRIGLVVLFVHDVSDIAIDLLKIFNYLRLEGKNGFFLVEIAYASTLAMWGYFRLYYYPIYIIGQGTISTINYFGTIFLPEGARPVLVYIAETLGPQSSEYYYVFYTANLANALLLLLFLLHIWWGALLLRILFKMIKANPHMAGKEEYEGESEDEDETKSLKNETSGKAAKLD